MTTNALLSVSSAPPRALPQPRLWVAAGAGAVVVVLLAGWLLVIAPQRTAVDDLRASTEQVESSESVLSARVTQLKQDFASLPERQAELAAVEGQLPAGAELPSLVRALRSAATGSGVELISLTPSPLVVPAAAASTTPAGGDALPGDGATAETAPTTATTASTGAGALQQLPLSVTAAGTYEGLERFLEVVQNQDRLVLLTGTSFAPGEASSSGLSLTITGTAFVLPPAAPASSTPSAAAPPGAAPAGAVQTS
ncbi:hypothetical protein FHN55_13305 [Streptomyces sp. NP160]|uniref:type 4a pilus biogenesis protein PilO n=1 Tax=Streptomyces sp. NP160 TaxID=2586637 RepID=UPI001117E0A0|nr:type 4a pilus biogenesis protein PilO [Streptomyces sp. NP160]TNM64501.1 hypothetical protein FHN55_13305 [Streptomyces sp. NP160]